jgi:dCMP deaminase
MQRPSWDSYFLQMAMLVATRGTCDRKRVGAVLVNQHRRVIATGYNGTPSGVPHCDDTEHTLAEIDGRQSCIATLHAESNALDAARGDTHDCTMYTTVIPCFDCAKRIVNAGITRVVYSEYYESRKTTLVEEYLARCNVILHKETPQTPLLKIYQWISNQMIHADSLSSDDELAESLECVLLQVSEHLNDAERAYLNEMDVPPSAEPLDE